MERSPYLPAIKKALEDLYGERLRGVILFGSEARGDASPDSDIDLLVLLAGPFDYWTEVDRIIHQLYPIQLRVLRPLDATPVAADEYEAAELPLLSNASREGLWL